MIIVYNFITLCKYLINNITGFEGVNCIEFEYINTDDDIVDADDDIVDADDEAFCNCNLCYTFRNIVFFATRNLKCKKM